MKFYDTSSLLVLQDRAFNESFYISSITIDELEHIKVSKNKTEDVRYAARKVTNLLNERDGYKAIVRTVDIDDILAEYNLPVTNDNLIVATAYALSQKNDIDFVTEDAVLRLVAKDIFHLNVSRACVGTKEEYRGYKEIVLDNEQMAVLYENLSDNKYSCLINEYLVVHNSDNTTVDLLKWNGESYCTVPKHTLKTIAFGDKIKPKDSFQHMAIDSIMSNTFTIIGGKAGSGKSLIALSSAMRLIETGKYDKLVILFNPTSARGAAKMGFYSGNMEEKALQSNIGNVLTTKFGDRYAVDTLIQQNKLKLVSMADCRGFEVRENEILYISEAQNSSTDLMKLSLTRVAEGAKVIVEGDYDSQVDDCTFEGDSNGMRKAIDIFKGEDLFGFVELKNVWRSRLAEIADKL